MMAQPNKGQPLAYHRQKVVYLPRVDKKLGAIWQPQSVSASQGNNDGGQLNPERQPLGNIVGSCLPEANRHTLRREEVRFGTWNVTGLGNREAELLDALVTYKLDVLGVAETWLKKGVEVEIPGYRWIGVAGENVSGKGGGVGFLLKDSIWNVVGEVIEVSSRIISMSLKVGGKDCSVIQVYAPTNDAPIEVKNMFWLQLREAVEKCRRKSSVIVMGDMNGRVGSRAEDVEVVGSYGEEVVNENGECLLELCRGSDLVVLNGWFPHKKVHKMTCAKNGRRDR